MEADAYRCESCGSFVPTINRVVHAATCRGRGSQRTGSEEASGALSCEKVSSGDTEEEEALRQALNDVRSPGQSDESWSCQRCTLENPKSLSACAACGNSQSLDSELSNNKWTCSACTYRNAHSIGRCEICGTSRDNSARVAQGDDEAVRPPDIGRRERLVDNPPQIFQFGQVGGDEDFDRSRAQLQRVMFSTIVGGLMGGVSAYANDRSLARGALEGASFGALTSSMLNEFESLANDQHPSRSSQSARPMQQESSGRRRAELRHRGRIRVHGGEPVAFDDFLRLFMSRSGFQGAESMDYESLLARFGDGSPNRQASEETLASIPSRSYEDDQVGKDDNEKASCAICLGDFKKGEQVSTLPCCHTYHEDCVKEWLGNVNSCPVCKKEVE